MLAFAFHQTFESLGSDWFSFPNHYLLYASSGAFHLEVGTSRWFLPPQRAAWILANTPFRASIDGPSTCSSVLFTPEAVYPPGAPCRVFAMSGLAREMIQYAMRWGRDRNSDRDRPLESDRDADRFFLSLAMVCNELAQQEDVLWLPNASSEELRLAMSYAQTHLANGATFEGAAAAAGISERTLARRFDEETQMNWQQYLRRARMIRAMALLTAGDAKVIEIAHQTGFKSQSAFIVAFREFSGESPSDYRRRLRSTV